jgi:hypothetical protein
MVSYFAAAIGKITYRWHFPSKSQCLYSLASGNVGVVVPLESGCH